MLNHSQRGYYATHPQKNEEYHLLYLAQQGDAAQTRWAKSLLIINNERFLRMMIKPWIPYVPWIQPNELIQEARLAFLAAIEKYDLSRDVSIRTYANFYLLELRRTIFRKAKHAYKSLPEDYEGSINKIPHLELKSFDLMKILIDAGRQALNTKEREIVFLHFFMGMKQKDIALRKQCSPARISILLREALGKMKRELDRKGISLDLLEQN